MSDGFHVAEFLPTPSVSVNAVRGVVRDCARMAVSCPGVKVPVPVVAVAGPDQYETLLLVIVSGAVPPPVVKSVEDTVVVHVAVSALRASVTVTGPICPVIDPAAAPLPRFTDAGTVIDRAPAVTGR
jgi:hypothetical protein